LSKIVSILNFEKAVDAHDADAFVHNCARATLAGNAELSRLSPAKLFDAINKADKKKIRSMVK
jgi:hypothetical protein